jgi:hypothetical protein
MAARKKSGGRKYGKAASKRVESAMRRKKKGTLKSGSGRKVTSRKQAIAIGLSEAREKGAMVPRMRSSAKKSASVRKSSAKKSSGLKSARRNLSDARLRPRRPSVQWAQAFLPLVLP